MERAQAWLRRYGRPLEAALWDFHFDAGSKEEVIRCLSAFQNGDGGFGHGLEPDFWLPQSSPMASWMAGRILLDIDADPQEPIVQRLIHYLLTTEQVRPGMWPSVLPENNAYPHAPWWHWSPEAQDGWMYNPSVELAAMLIHWSGSQGSAAELGWASLRPAVGYLMQADHIDWHGLKNYWQSLRLLQPFQDRFRAEVGYAWAVVEQKVKKLILAVVDRDVPSWERDYKPLPLDFVQGPACPLCPDLKQLVEDNLRFFLQSRTDWGIWDILWEWGQYPQEFAVARRYWQGILAVERYKILRAFNWLAAGICADGRSAGSKGAGS